MAKTIEQLKAQGAEVKNATVVGENTATRVGTLFTDIVEYIEQVTADGSTTTAKLAPLAVTTEKIANGAVTGDKIVAGTITEDNIADKSLSQNVLADNAVSTRIIQNGVVTIEKLADSAIDDEPTAGSENMVKSGGVAGRISELDNEVEGIVFFENDFENKVPSGTDNGARIRQKPGTDLMEVTQIFYHIPYNVIKNSAALWVNVLFYDSQKQYISNTEPQRFEEKDVDILLESSTFPNDAAYISLYFGNDGTDTPIAVNSLDYSKIVCFTDKYKIQEILLRLIQENNSILPDITSIQNYINDINDIIYTTTNIPVDVSSINEANYVISGNTEWYKPGTHVVVDVNPGDVITLIPQENKNVVLAFFKSYTKPVDADLSQSVQNLSDIYPTRIVISEQDSFTVPSDSHYVYLSKISGDGINNILPSSFIITRKTNIKQAIDNLDYQIQIEKSKTNFLKLVVGSWNVGNWALGAGKTNITDAKYEEKKSLYRNLLNGVGLDLICVQEFDPNFTISGTHLARESLFEQYKQFNFNASIRPDYGYHCNAIGSNGLQLKRTDTLLLAGSTIRHAYICIYEYCDTEICVMSLQSPWSRKNSTDPTTYPNSDNDAERERGFLQVINYASNYDYVIISGDFNVYSSDEYNTFTNAGFAVANHGYLGDIKTSFNAGLDSQQSFCLDNIICKGFAINKISIFGDDFRNQTQETQKVYSDHSGIMCECIMIKNEHDEQ